MILPHLDFFGKSNSTKKPPGGGFFVLFTKSLHTLGFRVSPYVCLLRGLLLLSLP